VIEDGPELAWRPRERPPRRRRSRRTTKLLVAAALLLAFGFGIAFGEAIHDNPKPSGPLTVGTTFVPTVSTISHP
jgi:hypothetical protein